MRYHQVKINEATELLIYACCNWFALSVVPNFCKIIIGEQSTLFFSFGWLNAYFNAIIVRDGGLHSFDLFSFIWCAVLCACLSLEMANIKIKSYKIASSFILFSFVSLPTLLISACSFYLIPDNSFIYIGLPFPFIFCCSNFSFDYGAVWCRICAVAVFMIDVALFYLMLRYWQWVQK